MRLNITMTLLISGQMQMLYLEYFALEVSSYGVLKVIFIINKIQILTLMIKIYISL